MKFFALVALALAASANASSVGWTSGLRKGTSLALGAPMALAGDIEFKFTPSAGKKVAAGETVKITASQKTWENDAATTCACSSADTGAQDCTAAVTGTGTILTVTMATAKELAAEKLATITCSTNLANLATAAAVTFNIQTTADSDALNTQTGYTVNAGTATWTSAARLPLGVAQTNGNLVLSFTTLNSIAADGTFKATASAALFAADGADKTTCTATCGGTANVVKSSTVADTKTSIEVKLTDACAKATAVVATCTGNLVNPAAGAVTFGFVTSGDIVALTGKTGFTTTAATSPIWTSASRSGFLGTGQEGGNLVVKFTPFKEVPAEGTVTITPSANIFKQDGAITCTATSDGNTAAVKTDGTATAGAVLTVKMTGALAAGKAAVITCTSNLDKANVEGAVTFSLATSTDATAITGQTGYTVLAGKQVTWTSAARASLETGKGGDLVVKFTPTTEVPASGTVTLTASSAIWTADAAATTCTATSDGTAQDVTAAVSGTKTILTVTLAADKKLTAAKAAVITCSSNLAVNGAKDTKVTFDIVTSADTAKVSGATGYTVTAVVAPTKAPTAKAATGNKTATVAAASTDGVNAGVAFTALCLAATALRQ